MASKKKDDKVYRYVLLGGSAMIRILLFVLAVVLLLAASRIAYNTGYSLFERTEEGEPSETLTKLSDLIRTLTARGKNDDH